jgi:hypothetical protein
VERLKEQNFEKLFLQSLKESDLSFLKYFFLPNWHGKFHSVYTECTLNDCSFHNIGAIKKLFPENSD